MTTRKPRKTSASDGRLMLIGAASLLLLLGGCNKQPANNTAAAPAQAAEAAAPAAPAAAPAPAPAAAPAAPQPAAPRPRAAVPAPRAVTPPPAAPAVYTVPSGSRLRVRISQTISAKRSNVGDSFSGSLVSPVLVNGTTVLRAGTPVEGSVVAAKGQGRFKGAGDLGVTLSSVGSQPVTTTAYEKSAKGKGKRSAEFIGGGGGGGALIGGLAGGGKGALIGGLLGAGAGTAGAMLTGNKDVTIPAESVITFTLTAPVRVTAQPRAAAPQQ